MRTCKASIVVMSHLSDVQETVGRRYENNEEDLKNVIMINKRINFAKFIILECNADLTQDINPDELWEKFNKI